MKSRLAFNACALCLAHATAHAQVIEHKPSRLVDLLNANRTVNASTAFDWPSNAHMRSGVDVRVAWRTPAHRYALFMIDAHSIANRMQRYSLSGVSAGLGIEIGAIDLSLSGGVAAGSGAGPGGAFTVTFGGATDVLRAEIQTTWLHSTLSPTDSTTTWLGTRTNIFAGRYTDALLHANYDFGPFALNATFGNRFGAAPSSSHRWANGKITVPVRAPFGIAFSGGSRADDPAHGIIGGKFAEAAIVFGLPRKQPNVVIDAPTLNSPEVERLFDGTARIRLHARATNRLEIKGDMTDWESRPMSRVHGSTDVWEVTLPMQRGVYKVNIRIDDGGWTVPEGLPAINDAFGGKSGLLSVN